MSNDKQTAVDWLLDRIEDVDLTEKLWENIKHQAKEMEKERELNAYANGQADTLLMFKQKISKMKNIPTEFNQIISENFWDLV
jgi:chlorite dismutase